MFSTYATIAKTVTQRVKEVLWADLDKGQVDEPEKHHSLMVPAILVGQADVEWSDLAGGWQQGIGTITVKTVVRLPAQTYLLDPLVLDNLKSLAIAEPINQAVLSVSGIISRLSTKEYAVGSFYVIEQTYEGTFKAGPSYSAVPVTINVSTNLINPTTAEA